MEKAFLFVGFLLSIVLAFVAVRQLYADFVQGLFWKRVPAVVLSQHTETHTESESDPVTDELVYSTTEGVVIRYEYEIEGQKYQGVFKSFHTNIESFLKHLRELNQPGEKIIVRVNPWDLSQSSLFGSRGFLYEFVQLFFHTLFFVFFSGVTYLLYSFFRP